MFLKKFFNKDYRYYQEKGEKFYVEERFADARHAFEEALEKIADQSATDDGVESAIRNRLAETCNRLALMNLTEAECALNSGLAIKAEEHLVLVFEMTTDPLIKEKAERMLAGLKTGTAKIDSGEAVSHECTGCATNVASEATDEHIPEHLSPQEHFELLVQTLPVSLQGRYTALGEEFATGYLMMHGGNDVAGALILQQLLKKGENDILLYELALTYYRSGDIAQCERYLLRSFELNSENALCCLGLVQLLTDTGRLKESLPVLNHMVDKQLLTEQALLFLGDVHLGLDDEGEAMANYLKVLEYKDMSRVAAERLIPLLERQGRREDAVNLAKRYLKGCC